MNTTMIPGTGISVGTAVPRIIDSRTAMYLLGVDVGADATVLAISGLKRLVWVKSHTSMLGGNGMPGARKNFAPTLEIRSFKRVLNGSQIYLQWDRAVELTSGGRLSLSRLRALSGRIDAEFGQGATDQLQLGLTTIFGDDDVCKFLAEQLARPRTMDPKIAAFIAAAEQKNVTSDGVAL